MEARRTDPRCSVHERVALVAGVERKRAASVGGPTGTGTFAGSTGTAAGTSVGTGTGTGISTIFRSVPMAPISQILSHSSYLGDDRDRRADDERVEEVGEEDEPHRDSALWWFRLLQPVGDLEVLAQRFCQDLGDVVGRGLCLALRPDPPEIEPEPPLWCHPAMLYATEPSVQRRAPHGTVDSVEKPVDNCRRCGADVIWADRWDSTRVLIDAAPSVSGEMIVVAVIDDGRMVVTKAGRRDPIALPRFTRHRLTCGVGAGRGTRVAARTASASR